MTLDNHRIECGEGQDNQWFQYQICNRTFCTSEARGQVFGSDYKWISGTGERNTVAAVAAVPPNGVFPGFEAVPLKRHPHLVAAQASITTMDRRPTLAVCTMRCGFDGQWPLSTQNMAMRALSKVTNSNSFLPPNCSVSITLHRRVYPSEIMERTDLTDEHYFQIGAAHVIAPVDPAYNVTINKITLLYESVTLADKKDIDELDKKRLEFPVDVPIYRHNDLNGGTMAQTVMVSLPRGTKFCYLLFLHESQTTPNAVANSYMSGRFRFLPHLLKLQLSLVGRDGLIFQEGFDGFYGMEGRRSHRLRTFHADLVRKGLYSKSFDEWVPADQENSIGYDNVIPLDLTPYRDTFNEISTLRVTMQYKQASEARWKLRTIAVVQRLYEFDKKTMWTWKDII